MDDPLLGRKMVGAEDANAGSFEATHVLELLDRTGVAEEVQRHAQIRS
jgi:hypothetical protein